MTDLHHINKYKEMLKNQGLDMNDISEKVRCFKTNLDRANLIDDLKKLIIFNNQYKKYYKEHLKQYKIFIKTIETGDIENISKAFDEIEALKKDKEALKRIENRLKYLIYKKGLKI